MSHFNKLSPAELERLSILAEECAEVIQVIGKIQRHGYESCHPNGGPNNRRLLTREIGDVKAAITLLVEGHDVDEELISDSRREKLFNIPQYLHHNKFLFPDYLYGDDEGAAQ